ncbi:Type VI secretion system Vgr family protein [Candidatus Bealeia paramacronuclearis]|uniref:hypothetical protein n=1 Tax=Candidatus Bealeia paramacronuclearis TaxID=1921001 RepID=UPI002C0E689C|nr:Type VI secretion system Vgr family protein [Candidatus Bealeia paramacronuclearis]
MSKTGKKQAFLTLSTPLGDDALTLVQMQGVERISTLFEYDLDLVSDNRSIEFDSLLSKKGTIKIDLGLITAL